MRQKLNEEEQEMKTKSAAIRREANEKMAALKVEMRENKAPAAKDEKRNSN
jgi:hypothetical protein